MKSRHILLLVVSWRLLFPTLGRAETPIISYPTEPVYVTNVLGETVEFDVTVDNDDGTFRYGWRKNGKSVLNPDGDGASFAKNVSIGNDAGAYACYVDNPLNESALSAPFYLTVLNPPVITAEPKDQTAIAGNNVTLTVSVRTDLFPTNFTYRWQFEGMDLFDDGEQVFGADTPSLTLSSIGPEDEGNYSVNIFNDATMLSLSGEPTTSTNAYLTVVVPPTISFDPDDDIETVGSPVEFSVVVDSDTTDTDQNPLTYQWRKNGINISLVINATATDDTLVIPTAQMADEGDYTVVVKNTGGAVTSAPAKLMFLPDLTDLSPGADFTVAAGTNVTFSATASGSQPLVFQWFIDDVPIPGANASNYTFRVGSADQSGGYSVQVSNYVCGLAGVSPDESIPVNLSVFPETNPPAITITNPADDGRPWSNAVISVRGTATDDGQIQAVRFQCNEDTNVYTAVGTNVWAADFPGVPGTNTITVYAVDGFGNQSPNATRKIFYVFPSPFTLVIAGKGTISSNWTGTNLEIGRVYRMSMTGAGSGYRFAGWSGGVTASSTSIDFMMQSNLVIQANFMDVYSPTFAITNPLANTVFSNTPAATVRGTVTDNSGGAEVRCRLNGGEWFAATGTNTWQADLMLLPGTNVFNAYAVDATGNVSVTNSLNLIYYFPTPLAVATSGQGVLSPDYTGQDLGIGRSYSMTATGTNGHKFLNWVVATNWAGGNISSNAALTFVMQSNLTLRATFADTNRPALTITNPAANSRFTNTTVNLQGTLTDNVAGATLLWRLGSNVWVAAGAPAATAGTNLWSIAVNPFAGTNTFSACAVDAAGNRSTTNTVSFIYAGAFAALVVQTNGQGWIAPDYNGQMLGIGQTFAMTATGTNGFVFYDWLGGDSMPLALATNTATISFVMRSNLALQAVFLDVQNPVVAITNALPGGAPPSLLATVGGTAADNDRVVAVMFRLNNGSWTSAAGTNSWSASFNLAAGSNTFSAYSVDAAGNHSATNTAGTFIALPGTEIGGLTMGGGGIKIGFPSVVGAVYRLECKNSLDAPTWTVLGDAVNGTGGVLSLTDPNPSAKSRYYRLRVEIP